MGTSTVVFIVYKGGGKEDNGTVTEAHEPEFPTKTIESRPFVIEELLHEVVWCYMRVWFFSDIHIGIVPYGLIVFTMLQI